MFKGFDFAPDDLSVSSEKKDKSNQQFQTRDGENLPNGSDVSELKVTLFPDIGEQQCLSVSMWSEGRFGFEDIPYFWLIGQKGNWVAFCSRPGYFIDHNGDRIHRVEIKGKTILTLKNVGTDCHLLIDFVMREDLVFHSYRVLSSEINIGSDENKCDIVLKEGMVSPYHASIYFLKNNYYIKDFNSASGTWVNGRRKGEGLLKIGDRVIISGLIIIIGINFLAINDLHNDLQIKSVSIERIKHASLSTFRPETEAADIEDSLYNRLPRRLQPFEPKKIQIEAPPISLSSDSIPLLLRMGGSVLMGGASALTGNVLMLLSTVLFPVLNQKYSDKEKKAYEEKRLEKYRLYLKKKQEEIIQEKEEEERILRENYPDLSSVLEYPMEGKQLWERRKNDDDFLKIRIGSGRVLLQADIEFPQQRFNLDVDVLEEEMFKLVEKKVYLDDVPIMADFIKDYVCAVTGSRYLAFSFVIRIIMSLAILHSYDEMKMMFLVSEKELQGLLEFVKYLPHTWNDQKDMRYIATTQSEAVQIGDYLRQQIEDNIKKKRDIKDILRDHPYYIVFAFDKDLFDAVEVLKDTMALEYNSGVSVITLFDDLPKDTSLLFDISSSGMNSIVYLKEITKSIDIFKLDKMDKILARKSMRCVENTRLKNVVQAYSLPKSLSFLEMYRVGRIEHLNIAKRWKDNNPVKSLGVPIGISTNGSPFMLDLHQKYQGPHGLVAGTTGSGKSEFLLTYILSMAVNFHPDEVSFVLIDYKGGGLAGAFDDEAKGIHLPHLLGTITNLDGPSIQRSLLSIQSELTRRQRIFNEVKSLSNEGTIDIYSYQKMYRNKIVDEPLPHLFIISDEFAELKQQRPEFMDKLISAARIGRSLGVHLILATQKPAGIVNDQIRSNTKFRVCLRVQDKADSQDMLLRPEAVDLKESGRFYLQVGYNEFFALGQSGWSGAPYEPRDEVVEQKDENVQIIDSLGQVLTEVKPSVQKSVIKGTQLTAIVKHLTRIADDQGIKVRQLWKPALGKRLDLEQIRDEAVTDTISCPLGLVDDPKNQKQFVLKFDLDQSQNLMIVGEASSGKTLLIQSMLYSLCSRYGSEELHLYILDYSSRMLKRFKSLPHCGAVLLEDESDKLKAFFDIISGIVKERKRLFSEIGADNYLTAKKMISIPLILVVIDNASGMASSKTGDRYLYNLQTFVKDGLNYGIRYIVSCRHLNDISSRLRQELGDRLCLQMKDKYDYGEALKCRVEYTPPNIPGRGLWNHDGRPLEFQAAAYHVNSGEKNRIMELERDILSLKNKYAGNVKAKRLPVTDEHALYEDFAEQFSPGRIPLGYSKETGKPVALPLKQFSLLSIYQADKKGYVPLLNNFLYAAFREKMDVWFVSKDHDSNLPATDYYSRNSCHTVRNIVLSRSNLEALWHELAEEIKKRIELRKGCCSDKEIADDRESMEEKAKRYVFNHTRPLMIMIEDYADFCNCLDHVSMLVYDRLFRTLKGLNIYLISFFKADDPDEIKKNYLYSGFNINGISMLFGGDYAKQSIVDLPGEIIAADKSLPFNLCLMRYRQSYHGLLMPCGEMEEIMDDPDSRDIFV